MPRFTLKTIDDARPHSGDTGGFRASHIFTYFEGENDPLHLHMHELTSGEVLDLAPSDLERLAYIWRGSASLAGHQLRSGSSVIVESARGVRLEAGNQNSSILIFSKSTAPSPPRAGGNVHVLPAERVPVVASLGSGSRVGGALHADAGCPTCSVWLHENHFPKGLVGTPEGQARGIHSHEQDEIIFVIEGQLQLSDRIYGPGTAMAIHANTRYGFTPTNEGLKYINFRPGDPGEVSFATGEKMREATLWEPLQPKAQPIHL